MTVDTDPSGAMYMLTRDAKLVAIVNPTPGSVPVVKAQGTLACKGRTGMWMRSIHRILGAVLVGGAVALFGSWPVLAQEVPSAEAIERMARVFTELDPEIKAVEMRSDFAAFGDAGGATRYLFRYASPDQYILLVARAEDQAAYVAVAENKTVIYDVRRGRILLVQGAIPNIRIENRDARAQVYWGINLPERTSREPTAKLLVDFPSLLRFPAVRARDVESLGGGKYRLTHTTESGDRMIATVGSLSPFAFTGLEILAKERRFLNLELRVNQQVPPFAFSLPQIESLRARFKVEQTPAPKDFNSMMRIVGVAFLPLGFGPGNREFRDLLDKMLGERNDWRAMEARYRRDLPKLRQLLPMPQ